VGFLPGIFDTFDTFVCYAMRGDVREETLCSRRPSIDRKAEEPTIEAQGLIPDKKVSKVSKVQGEVRLRQPGSISNHP
jgi:hypothetical protein